MWQGTFILEKRKDIRKDLSYRRQKWDCWEKEIGYLELAWWWSCRQESGLVLGDVVDDRNFTPGCGFGGKTGSTLKMV